MLKFNKSTASKMIAFVAMLLMVLPYLQGCTRGGKVLSPADAPETTANLPEPTQTVGSAPGMLIGEEASRFLMEIGSFQTEEGTEAQSPEPKGDFPQTSVAAYPSWCFALTVPFISQVPPGDWSNTKNCGQACGVMMGAYFNGGAIASWVITEENKWLYRYTGNSNYLTSNGWYTGTGTLPPLFKAFHNLQCRIYYGNGPDDVVMEGANRRPVIVAVRTSMSTTGVPHYMLFVGWDGTYMYFNDPGKTSGRFVRYTPAQFYASWNTQNRLYMPISRT